MADLYYHGGRGGHRPGDVITPDPDDPLDIAVEVHTKRAGARLAAASVTTGGALYRVETTGPVALFGTGTVGHTPLVRVVAVLDAVVKPRTKRDMDRIIRAALR